MELFMSNEKTHTEKTSAEKSSIGFEYQYYFFLWKLLSLRPGESVGLEVKDDVHTELDNDEQILYQVKHTLKMKSDGTPANLTESDTDLWKTFSNWALVISDKNDNRGSQAQQLIFLEKTTFVLASNKSSAGKNTILSSIISFQETNLEFSQVKAVCDELRDKTTSSTTAGYIEDVLNLENTVLEKFINNISFELDEKNILAKCKDAIRADKILETKIEQVFANINSAIRSDNFINIKKGKKIQISFDDFYLKYRRHYDLARNGSLPIKEFKGSLPENLEAQIFIEQLIEIDEVQVDDIEEIAKLTSYKLKLQNNIDNWVLNGEITGDEINRFKNDAIVQWYNKHKSAFRGTSEESDFNDKGLDVLDSMREKKLILSEQVLDTDLSNGTFYHLSDIPDIGWRKDWGKYKK